MQRKKKFAVGEYYHLYSRGVEKRKIFLSQKDYDRFMALLFVMNQSEPFHFTNFLKHHKISDVFEIDKKKSLVSILSYALIPNHFHLLVYEHAEGGISKFMSRLLTAYSMYFNTKYERSGPLFLHPFRSQHVFSEPQYLWIFSYIHLNPLGIIKKDFLKNLAHNRKRAENFLDSYAYSSYFEYSGGTRPESHILQLDQVPEYVKGQIDLGIGKYREWLIDDLKVSSIKDYP